MWHDPWVGTRPSRIHWDLHPTTPSFLFFHVCCPFSSSLERHYSAFCECLVLSPLFIRESHIYTSFRCLSWPETRAPYPSPMFCILPYRRRRRYTTVLMDNAFRIAFMKNLLLNVSIFKFYNSQNHVRMCHYLCLLLHFHLYICFRAL